jgi:hypothetical protein
MSAALALVLSASGFVAHGGTIGAIVELALFLVLAGVFAVVWLRARRADGDETRLD